MNRNNQGKSVLTVIGISGIIFSLIFIIMARLTDVEGLDIFMMIFGVIPSIFLIYFDPIKFRKKKIDRKTSRIHEMTVEGIVHSKDKTTHVDSYNDAIYYNHEYITRIKTPIGFYDSYDKNEYLTYKEGDEVKILVRTRYDKNDKPFMEEVLILHLL